MIEEHLTDQQVEAYRQRAVEASDRNALVSHLAVCEACLQRVINTEHFDVAYTSLKESFLSPTDEAPFHLSLEELKRYRAGKLDEADRTIFESHLMDCAECNRLAQESLLVSPNAAEQSTLVSQTTWQRLAAYWPRQTSLRPIYIGGIALACVSSPYASLKLAAWSAKPLSKPSVNGSPSALRIAARSSSVFARSKSHATSSAVSLNCQTVHAPSSLIKRRV